MMHFLFKCFCLCLLRMPQGETSVFGYGNLEEERKWRVDFSLFGYDSWGGTGSELRGSIVLSLLINNPSNVGSLELFERKMQAHSFNPFTSLSFPSLSLACPSFHHNYLYILLLICKKTSRGHLVAYLHSIFEVVLVQERNWSS